jgi:hypothetical protein
VKRPRRSTSSIDEGCDVPRGKIDHDNGTVQSEGKFPGFTARYLQEILRLDKPIDRAAFER